MSFGLLSAILSKNGANSSKAVSFLQSNQLQIKIPLSGCSMKFSATLSTIITFEMSLPSQSRSLIKTNPFGEECYQ